MRIRNAHPSDASAIATLWRRSIRDLCAETHQNDPEKIARWCTGKTPEEIKDRIETDAYFLVAEQSGEIFGFLSATPTLGAMALYVSPDHVRKGVGRRLLSCLERALIFSQESGTLFFHSAKNAIGFYEKCGYHRTGEEELFDGLPVIPVSKRLR